MPTTKQRIYMCDACEVSSRVQNNGELDSEFLDVATVFDRRIEANRHNDWAALILASFVVALAASSEVRDILLVDFYYVHQHSSGRWRGQGFFHEDSVWRLALIYLGILRQYVFLPVLVQSVCSLVITQGGDAINVCLNAVAVLFLTELDNAMFLFGLSDTLRSEVEGMGKVPINRDEQRAFTVLKVFYLIAIPLCVILTVTLSGYEEEWKGLEFMDVSLYSSFTVFAIGAVLEAFVASGMEWKHLKWALSQAVVCGAFGMATLTLVTLALPKSPACGWGLLDESLC